MKIRLAIAALLAAILAAPASAGSIVVTDGVGAGTTLNAGSMPDVLSSRRRHALTRGDLAQMHRALNGDGVATDGMITFMLLETGRGLSLLSLVDDVTSDPAGDLQRLSMTTTGSRDNGWAMNDVNRDVVGTSGQGDERTISAAFRWRENRADGFAWTGLDAGDGLTFDFEPFASGLLSGDAVQFVTWTDEGWQRAAGFGARGPFDLTFAVVPLPPAALMGLIGLAGAVVGRRRMFRKHC